MPFGFGLSYTTFTYSPKPTATKISLAPVRELLDATTVAGRTFPSSKLLAEAAPLIAYMVNVTNTGKMDAVSTHTQPAGGCVLWPHF